MTRLLPYLLLAALVAAGYANTLGHSFHYDDIPQILEKPWVRGLDKIPHILTHPLIRPVVVLSFNLNHAVSGFEVWSYHIVNILLHIGVAWMLYRLVLLTGKGVTRAGVASPAYRRMALVAGALFALHPLNIQTVTYISSRSSSLCTLFYLLVMELAFRGYLARGSGVSRGIPQIAGALVCLLLGALSKEIIITIPALLFLYHFYFFSGQRFGDWLRRQAAKLLLVAVPLAGFIAWRMLSEAGVLPTGKTYLSPATYLLTETFVIPFEYFRKMLFPVNLSIEVFYPTHSDWGDPMNFAGIVTLGLFVWAVCRVSRTQPWAGFGLAWMGITLLPTSSFVPLHDVAVEHRTYLPLVGFAWAAAAAFEGTVRAAGSWRHHQTVPWALGGVGLVLVLYALLLVDRNAVWKDEVTLWTDAKIKAPRLVRPYNNLGEAYDALGRYEDAIREFQAALKIDPNYVFALNNLGNVYGKLEQYQRSLVYFERALQLDETYAPAHYNLARALQAVNRPQEAMTFYRRAIELVPYFEEAIFNYAMLGVQLGKSEESIPWFKRFIELQPQNRRGYFGLGNAHMTLGRFDEAIAAYTQTVRMQPDYLPAYVNLAAAQMQSGKIDAAIATYHDLLKRSPGIAGVHKNLGLIYGQYKPDREKALFHFEESLRLDPNQPEAAGIRRVIEDLKQAPASSDG